MNVDENIRQMNSYYFGTNILCENCFETYPELKCLNCADNLSSNKQSTASRVILKKIIREFTSLNCPTTSK